MILDKIRRLFLSNGDARQREQKRRSIERLDHVTTQQLRAALANNRRVTEILEALVQGARRTPPPPARARGGRRRGKT